MTAASPTAPSRRRWDGLLLFRCALALWVAALPWLLDQGVSAHGLNNALTAAALIAVACFAERWPATRLGQAALALWLVFTPFVLETSELSLYGDVLTAKVLFLSAAASRQMFS